MFHKHQNRLIGVMVISTLLLCITYEAVNAESQSNDDKIFISSYVKICILKEPAQGQQGWQPRAGVKIVTKEGETGVTGDNCYIEIPVYNKEPLELIKIKIGGKTFEVPTFGPKDGIKGGDIGSVYFSPKGKIYISIYTCPDVYEYLKKNYKLDVHPYDKDKDGKPKLEPQYPCNDSE